MEKPICTWPKFPGSFYIPVCGDIGGTNDG